MSKFNPAVVDADYARKFIRELWSSLESNNCPSIVNISRQFRAHVIDNLSVTQDIAEESFVKLKRTLLEEIERRSVDWEMSGVPRPLALAEAEDTLVTWRHERYEALTGYAALSPRFAEVSQWLIELTPRGFLVPCVLVLKILGATRIFVTDGPHDEGIDIVARLGRGPLQSTAVFCQVKTHHSHITRDSLLAEYGKFLALPHTKKYRVYRDALGLDESVDGSSYCYVCLTNQGFAIPARKIASSLGILLRSRIQIAHWLMQHFTVAELEKLQAVIGIEPSTDLTKNLADLISGSI